MRITRDTDFVGPEDKGAVVAIGNFDGVHLGHQAVIEIARAEAARRNGSWGVMTFEPHPRQLFAKDAPPFRLMNSEARAHRLDKIGVEVLFELPFTTGLAALTPEMFVQEILSERLGLAHVVVGQDFCFGKDRAGTSEDLKRLCAEAGIGVTVAPLLEVGTGEVSSTAIRKALSDGRPRDAAAMLGHWHRIEGAVIQGDQRGRDLGYPTANMSIEGLHPPRFGVYVAVVDVLTGPHAGSYGGAASIGVRPTFGTNVANCETYLFDFAGDLYGEHLSVGLIDYLRPEETFDDLDALIRQMDADCASARTILAGLRHG